MKSDRTTNTTIKTFSLLHVYSQTNSWYFQLTSRGYKNRCKPQLLLDAFVHQSQPKRHTNNPHGILAGKESTVFPGLTVDFECTVCTAGWDSLNKKLNSFQWNLKTNPNLTAAHWFLAPPFNNYRSFSDLKALMFLAKRFHDKKICH